MAETLVAVNQKSEGRQISYGVNPNVDCTVKHSKSAEFQELYAQASLVVVDGVPLLWAAKMLGTPLKERINGTDLFERTCELAEQQGYSVFLLAAGGGAPSHSEEKLVQRHPGLKIAGWDCPV